MKQRIFSFLFGVVVLFTMFDITAYAKQNDMREIAYISKEIQKQDVQSTLNTISDSVESSSDFFYDGIRAVSIAKTHVDNDQNIYGSSTYQDRKKCTNGWLCAEFVATCVCEGGGLSRNYLSPSGSTFRENLLASGYCTEYVVRVRGDGYIHKADFTGVIAPGDVVFYKCPNYEGGKPYVHTVMFAGWRSDGLLQAYAHNGRNTGNAQYYKNCGYCNADISEAHILHFNKNNYTGNQLPQGVVDLIEGREGAIEILGWAFDRDDSSKSLTINVYVGGPAGVGKLYSVVADISRPDVVGAYPGVNEKCGFHNIVYVSERGEQEVYVYAVDANDSSKSTLLIEKTVTIRNIPFSIQFGQDTLVMERGDSTELSCSFKGDGIYSLAYLFSDPSIASLTKVTGVDWTTGVCTLHFEALTAGTTKFTFYLKDKEGNLLFNESMTITVKVPLTEETYVIKYDANGGSGAPAQQTKTYGSTLTLSSTKPSRTGYTFKNWNTKADGSGTSYASGASYTENVALTLYAQWTVNTYAVKYDANGGSGAPAQQTKTYGKTLTLSSTKPTRTGYTFKNWNIKADGSGTSYAPGTSYTGNAALTLYAQWEPLLKVSPISDITFTGREVKPEVVITDNGKVLKKGTDYTVVYKNNINVNTIKKVNEGIGSDFNENLPYVAVIGKGNYSGTIYINFNIVALPISDTSGNPTAGITLNLSENLVCNNTSAQTVFKSIRSTVAMREGQDFLLSLKTVSAKDATGKAVPSGTSLTENRIPTGYTGSFQLKIMGKGNYSGTITKNIYVQEKNHLLSTAIITLGSNLKTTTYTGSAIQLTPGYYDKVKKQHFIVKNNAVSTTVASANDVFTVKCGNEYLVAGRDYTISYSGNNSVGTATMTLTGNGEYSGTKSITFKVAGAQFNVSKVTVSGIVDKDYTGKPVTQSGLKLYYSIGNGKTKELISGQDYVVSYKNNTNKGTATVQFTGLASAGYTGSFSKTFKINAVSINDTAKVIRGSSMSNISISYAKGGAKPSGMVALTNVSGAKLVEGKDYKITYKNNKIIANTMAVAPPIMIIQGVGNYTGNISVPFSITQKAITSADIKVTVSQIQYNPKAKDSYVYMPSVKVTDQGVNMVRNVDYTMEYVKNTKADYDAYQKKVANGTAKIEDCPRVVVRAKAGGNYTGTDALVIELPIYPTKIKNTNVKIIITEMTYSGMQLTPKVAVYYNDDSKAMQRAKYITNENELLALGFVKLTANTDYVLEYGTNIVSGRNKGKVTIIGTGKTFGGKITGSFTINAKELKIIE